MIDPNTETPAKAELQLFLAAFLSTLSLEGDIEWSCKRIVLVIVVVVGNRES